MKPVLKAFAIFAALIGLTPLFLAASSSQLCVPGWGCLTGVNGGDLFIDTDQDGALDSDELNLTINAATGSDGNETVQGDLVVVGNVTWTGDGVTRPHETLFMNVYSNAATITAGHCLQMIFDAAFDANCTNSFNLFALPFKTYITRWCISAKDAVGPSDLSYMDLYNDTGDATVSSISINATGADWTGADETSFCATVNQSFASGVSFAIQCRSAACNGINGRMQFTIWGYGVD